MMNLIKKTWGILFIYLFVIISVVTYVNYANKMVLEEESKVTINK